MPTLAEQRAAAEAQMKALDRAEADNDLPAMHQTQSILGAWASGVAALRNMRDGIANPIRRQDIDNVISVVENTLLTLEQRIPEAEALATPPPATSAD